MLKNQQKNCIFYSFFTNFVKFNVNFNIFFIKKLKNMKKYNKN